MKTTHCASNRRKRSTSCDLKYFFAMTSVNVKGGQNPISHESAHTWMGDSKNGSQKWPKFEMPQIMLKAC